MEKNKVVKTYVEMDRNLWKRFKDFLKQKGVTLKRGHEEALKNYIKQQKGLGISYDWSRR